MIIHYKGPVLILYTAVLLDPATWPWNYDTSPVVPGHWYPAARAGRTDGKTRGRVRAHSSPWLSQILGNQSRDHVVQHLLSQWPGSYPAKYLQLFCILCSCLKQKCFLAGTFSHWLSCYAIPIIRPSPPYTSTMWLSKTIDAPICQRANKFPSSASRTKSTCQGGKRISSRGAYFEKKCSNAFGVSGLEGSL